MKLMVAKIEGFESKEASKFIKAYIDKFSDFEFLTEYKL